MASTNSKKRPLIISGLEEKLTESRTPENLAKVIRNFFIHEMGIEEDSVDALQINVLYRMGEKDKNRKYPRPVCVQFANKINKDTVMSKIKTLKDKKIADQSCQSSAGTNSRNAEETLRNSKEIQNKENRYKVEREQTRLHWERQCL